MSEGKILDVGCGERPRGTTNLDLTQRDVPNFVLGNALDLPFEDNSFETVYSSGLSLWSEGHPDSDLLKAWKEAIRVAKDQVIMEYNYLHSSLTWNGRNPLAAINWLHSEVSENISLEYSNRGKMAWLIRPFEKVFGTEFTISVLNKLFRRSYYGKFKYSLTDKKNLPEIFSG